MSRIDLPGYGIERVSSYPPEPACVVCKGDCIPLNEAGECADCAPKEDETCEEWLERMKTRRAR